jgi:hypothetical protein
MHTYKSFLSGIFVFGFLAPSGQTTHGSIQGVLVSLSCFTAVSLFVYIFNTLLYYIYKYIASSIISLVLMFGLYLPLFIVYVLLIDPRIEGEEEGVVHNK